jgi:maleate isomerase
MHGWRKRIGLIVPSSNTTMESELWMALPEGISLHTARLSLRDVNTEALGRMELDLRRAVEELTDACVDCVLFGCTSGTLIRGAEHNMNMSSEIENALGVPFITTSRAVVEALKTLGMKKISIVTPYIGEVNEKEKEFLEDSGFDVVSINGLGIEKNVEIGKKMPEEVYRFAEESFVQSDGLFISCTNLRTFEVIETLEKDLGIPVVTSNQASLWFALKRAGVGERITGLGELLTV